VIMISNVITASEFYIVFVKKHVNIRIDDSLILKISNMTTSIGTSFVLCVRMIASGH